MCCDVCHCYPVDGDPWLLYSDRSDLRRISTDDSHSNKILISGLNYPLAMDYHYRFVSVCLLVCTILCLFVCLSVCLYVCLSVSLYCSVCLSVCLSVSLYYSVCLSVCLLVCTTLCVYVCVLVCMRVCMFGVTTTIILLSTD